MKKLVLACAVLGLLGAFLSGCGKEEQTGSDRAVEAMMLHPGTPKYFEMQTTCPVCGESPISEDYYVDINGKRLYFDKAECKKEFQGNQEQYLEEYKEKANKAMMGGDESE